MTDNKQFLISLLVWLTVGLIACNDSKIEPGVDPNAGTCYEEVEITNGLELIVIETSAGRSLLSDAHGLLFICDEVDFNFDQVAEGTWLSIDGGIGSDMDVDFIPIDWNIRPMISENVALKTDPYVPQGVTIEIFEVDNQYGQGYGYFIEFVGTRILQEEVPGVAGLKPFTTYIQAEKVALYVAYLLKSANDFPSVYEPDLDFLLIDY